MSATTLLKNIRLCHSGTLLPNASLAFTSDGFITDSNPDDSKAEVIDLNGAIVAPGLIELQTNGMRGFHFTHFDAESYAAKIEEVARYLVTQGVTSFYATVPTVAGEEFRKILPSLAAREIDGGASLLGAHAEGPYLNPSKKGAHDSSLFQQPSVPPTEVYGKVVNDNRTLKLVTVAPALENSTSLISSLVQKGIKVSLGHCSASYSSGLEGIKAGATCLTHTLNAMAPLHHRDPGLAGLVTAAPSTLPASPYFSIIPDGNHLHPSVASMLFRANPEKCIIITDSIELAGLEDGTYPGHSQIPFNQTKKGSRVVIEGTETLIGGCASLAECATNLKEWSGCGIAEVMRCATENVARFMGEDGRGTLEFGKRADFVVLDDDDGAPRETWVAGKKAWQRS